MPALIPGPIDADMRTLTIGDLVLEPLCAHHAETMFTILNEPGLHRYLDQAPPPSLEHLRGVYLLLEDRTSPDGSQHWLNWVVRPAGQAPIGYVQATITANRSAWLGYVISTRHWGRGHATQAVQAVIDHAVARYRVERFRATVELDNERSIRVLGRLGFRAAGAADLQGRSLTPSERLFVRGIGVE